MFKIKRKNKKTFTPANTAKGNFTGFTLVELLVVISIIGFLATFAVYALNIARIKARDTKRVYNAKQIQKALQLYYDENNAYPLSNNCNSTIPNTGWCNSTESMLNGHWIRQGSTINLGEFLTTDPIDPKPSAPNFITVGNYYYYSNGQWYMLVFKLEQGGHPLEDEDGVTDCNETHYHYNDSGVLTLGGSCE